MPSYRKTLSASTESMGWAKTPLSPIVDVREEQRAVTLREIEGPGLGRLSAFSITFFPERHCHGVPLSLVSRRANPPVQDPRFFRGISGEANRPAISHRELRLPLLPLVSQTQIQFWHYRGCRSLIDNGKCSRSACGLTAEKKDSAHENLLSRRRISGNWTKLRPVCRGGACPSRCAQPPKLLFRLTIFFPSYITIWL